MTLNRKDSFVHLHVHTEYSMLDGASKLDELIDVVDKAGMPAVASTDHGNVFGAYEFVSKARDAGINPIVGMEAYMAPESRKERRLTPIQGLGEPQRYSHMTLLSKNNDGMQNLFRLSSLASISGFYYQPRIDRELLSQYSEGLIGTTGCMGGEVKQLLSIGEYDVAKKVAAEFHDIFGKGNFFVEIMDHGIAEENRLHKDLIRLSRELNIPLVATNDSHYTYAEQAEAHEALLCIGTKRLLSDPKRFKFDGGGYHIKTPEEMRSLWHEFPEACDNTLLIAEQCDVSFERRNDVVPVFPVPSGHTESTYLREETFQGIERRYGHVDDVLKERAEYELGVIDKMGYPGYMLIVSDLIRWGKTQGIRFGPGRGSVGGSLVAYALDITELDPIKHGLMFERFLNPDRISMPDVDMDIQDDRRHEVIAYAIRTYGIDNVAQIITYGTIKGKSSIKDSARVLEKPVSLANELSRVYPPAHQGKDTPLSAMFTPSHKNYGETSELRRIYESNPDAKQVLDLARDLEGLKRQFGIHAAGVVLCDKPLIDVLPVIKKDKEEMLITQFDMEVVEKLGFLKMDFLGLKNLTIMEGALKSIEERSGKQIVLEDLPLDDPKAFKIFASGNTLGVFQLDSPDMRKLLRRMKPTSFDDISAVLALYRPGPMGVNAHNRYADRKNGREEIDYIHPELSEILEPILNETYGLIVYQEQVLLIAQQVAGYTLPRADLLRKAMGKKNKEILDKEAPAFLNGMLKRGYSEEAFQVLWDILVPFSDYAFNKAHTAGYGLVAYWTAYLKANYPSEYMSALLSAVAGDLDRTALYLSECRRMGVEVVPPSVNESSFGYTVNDQGQIVFGLGAIKGIGEGPVASILETRQKDGEFRTVFDLFYRTQLTKRQVEPLIEAGALDHFGYGRKALYEQFLPILNDAKNKAEETRLGAQDLFSLLRLYEDEKIDISDPDFTNDDWEMAERLERERKVTSVYLSGHPLDGYTRSIEEASTHDWSEITAMPHGAQVIVGGLLTDVSHAISKRGNPWCSMNLMSMDGVLEMRCFSADLIQKRKHLMEAGKIVMVKASILNDDGDSVSLRVDGIRAVTARDEELREPERVVLTIAQKDLNAKTASALKDLFTSHRGRHPVSLEIRETGDEIPFEASISTDDVVKRSLLRLLGNECIKRGFGETN